MNFYLSGVYNRIVEDFIIQKDCYRLLSAAYEKEIWHYTRYAEEAEVTGCNLIIDSGAFTAWNSGKPMKLDTLHSLLDKILEKAPQHNYHFIALDVIPGEAGRMATSDEIKAAVDESVKNFEIQIERYGNVLPVFHTGEDMELLHYYFSLTDYVCLSPNQNMSEMQRFNWVNNVYLPEKKFHGLATTGNKMLGGFDWFSVDSAGWLMVAAMGSIIMVINGKMKPIAVSDQSPNLKKRDSHIDNFHAREHLLEIIEEKGYDIKTLRSDPAERMKWNITELYAFKPNVIDQQNEGLFPL